MRNTVGGVVLFESNVTNPELSRREACALRTGSRPLQLSASFVGYLLPSSQHHQVQDVPYAGAPSGELADDARQGVAR
jgi:hypothetical protein